MLTVPPRENIYINLLACLHSSQALKYFCVETRRPGILSFQSSFTSKSIFLFTLRYLSYSISGSVVVLMKEQNRCSLQNKPFFKENLCLQCVVMYTKTAYRIGNQELAPFVVLKCVFFC